MAPAVARAAPASGRDFGVYVHVPFCSVRCGYCDFNTYAPGELAGASREGYVEAALMEMTLARGVMTSGVMTSGVMGADPVLPNLRPASTVFFGGGTPTMLEPAALARLLDGVRQTWGLAEGAEVTTEANPDSVDDAALAALAEAGFTRVSLGMQSAVPHVLRTLDRTHHPENVVRAVAGAKAAGLATSLDLIYGTPGESLDDWRESVAAAIALAPEHVSAYALVIEPGTKMGARLRRGEISPVDPDVQAEMYEAADDALAAAGYSWYEVSNWARTPADACRHNVGYWRGQDWWGIGPGAHSYLEEPGGTARRWWNVKHPRAYAERLGGGESPEEGGEDLTDEQRYVERVMLGIRLAQGLQVSELRPAGRARLADLGRDGLIETTRAGRDGAAHDRAIVLTRRGRLLADAVIRDLAWA
jgi:putative oxygen-independent coproporphyrinogen III oxidase